MEYALLLIKPMSIGRGDGPEILGKILQTCPVNLRLFRSWVICDTTLYALSQLRDTDIDYDQEKIHPLRFITSWVCLFTHVDGVTDPSQVLKDYCGPSDKALWTSDHLRKQYCFSDHLSDTVVHIASPKHAHIEASLLFENFDPNLL